MNILFRADSSSIIGTGHIMRDLVLAKKYAQKGHNIIFATQDLEGNINQKILEAGYKIEILKSNKFKELNRLIKKLKIDKTVIDHYGINYKFEKKLKIKNSALKIMVLDDLYDSHYCDILLNHNIYAKKKKYKNLVPKNCKLKCGAKYTLLRDEFIKEKNKIYKPNKKFTFFIAMGGADTSNLNPKILKVLSTFNNIKVHLVTTTSNKHLKELKKYCKNKKWVKLHINSTKIAKLMRKSDLAIVTPSVTLNEIYFIGIDFIAIKTASNQQFMYDYLKNNDYKVMEYFDYNKLIFLSNLYIKNIRLNNFLSLSKKQHKQILKMRNSQQIKKWMYSQDTISLKEHLKYVKKLRAQQDKKYFLITKNNKNIGVIDFTNIKNNSAEFGIYSNPKLYGQGKSLMQIMIEYSFNILNLNHIKASVFSDNTKAIDLYKKFNFKKIDTKIVNNKKVICMELKNENR